MGREERKTNTVINVANPTQLKEVENSEKQARNSLFESKKEVQVLKAELQSVERTAKTISLVKEQSYESAKREVGSLLLMQEKR